MTTTDGAPRWPRGVLLVVNPAARRSAARERRALATLAELGIAVTRIASARAGDVTTLLRERAAAFDAVLTLGGDGTAMEAITALAGSGPPIGVLPGGTANVLARTLGVPLRIDRAVRALASGAEARLDLGRLADGRVFAIGLGVGLDATMIGEASAALKRRLGIGAYVVSALRAGLRFERFPVRLTVDGRVHEQEASAVLLANFGVVANGWFTFGDGIAHDDGLLNACIFSPRSRVDALRIAWRMLRRGPSGDRALTYLAGRRFRIETSPARAAQADGEIVGTTPLEVEVLAGAGRVLVAAGGLTV